MRPDDATATLTFALGHPFRLASLDHLAAGLAVLAWVAAMAVIGRRWGSDRGRRILSLVLSGFLLCNELCWLGYRLRTNGFDVHETVPLHLCDIALICLIVALATRWRWAFEFAYFFGLGGAIQALATPNLDLGFPDYGFVKFFISHGGIVSGVVYLTCAFGMRPTRGAVRRMFVAGNVYMALAGVFNIVAGTNYGFLCEKPVMNSLLDYLGPWPWYLVSIEAIGTLILLVLYAPFYVFDRLRAHAAAPRETGDA